VNALLSISERDAVTFMCVYFNLNFQPQVLVSDSLLMIPNDEQ